MCLAPLVGFRSRVVNADTQKRSIVFNPRFGFSDMKVLVPCGKCAECRASVARQRALRCWLESLAVPMSCVITLTYNDDYLPSSGSVREVGDYQKFLKRLRKKFGKVRYFGCGEYGELNKRFHYHIILYGCIFDDLVSLKRTDSGSVQYTSKTLEKLWPFGFSTVGVVTPSSCSYIAGYVNKKLGGEINSFSFGSRKPGIGFSYMSKYGYQALKNGFIVMDGQKYSVPRFFLDKLDEQYPLEVYDYKVQKFESVIKGLPDSDSYCYGDFVPPDSEVLRRKSCYYQALPKVKEKL